jgi:hypothetical protein
VWPERQESKNDVIFGGYAGMAWVRWSDKVNSERLKIMMCALQAKNTTFGLVMRGAAYRLQQYTMSDSPALERKFSMADEAIGSSQWLARLWEWTSQNGIRMHCADLLLPEKAPTIRLVDSISAGKCNKNIMRRGCHAFNVLTKFDLLQADGITTCANMRSGGTWETTDPEWTKLVRTHLGWHAEDSTDSTLCCHHAKYHICTRHTSQI